MKERENLTRKGVVWDRADDALVESHHWYVGSSGPNKAYVYRQEKQDGRYRSIFLHREILDASQGFEVDHINGNSLDNRRCNLRLVTRRQNCWNTGPKQMAGRTSRFKGVGWNKRQNCWVVRIYDHGKKVHLGSFHDELQAAAVYNRAAQRLFGEFAYLNSVEDES